jgi:signal transduction histidine kinase
MLDDQFEVLSERRRRRILVGLELEDRRLDPFVFVPRRDSHDVDHDSVSGDDLAQLRQRHITLPELDASGYVSWDRETNEVTRGPRFEEIRPLLRFLIANADEPDGWAGDRSSNGTTPVDRRHERAASVLAHDLRNPLAVLKGSLELAESTGDPEQFERCYAAVDRIETLVDDLLTMARADRVVDDPAPVDLGALATQCWETVATGDATLSVDTERTILADEHRLRQLLENLFRNSVEHGSTGSRPQAGDSVEHGGNGVTITVGDLADGFFVAGGGPGIPAGDRDRVFEAGYSAIPDGTGLGLAIVREITEAHGWDVTVVEGAEGGARFEFTGVDTDTAEDNGTDGDRVTGRSPPDT